MIRIILSMKKDILKGLGEIMKVSMEEVTKIFDQLLNREKTRITQRYVSSNPIEYNNKNYIKSI